MSRYMGTVTFMDGTVRFCRCGSWNGPRLFISQTDLLHSGTDDGECTCCNQPELVVIRDDYGESWIAKACKTCSVLLDQRTPGDILDGLPLCCDADHLAWVGNPPLLEIQHRTWCKHASDHPNGLERIDVLARGTY